MPGRRPRRPLAFLPNAPPLILVDSHLATAKGAVYRRATVLRAPYLFLLKPWLVVWVSSEFQSDADDGATLTFSFLGFFGSRPLRSWLFAMVSSRYLLALPKRGDTEEMDSRS